MSEGNKTDILNRKAAFNHVTEDDRLTMQRAAQK
jgi:hypothetical protein